MYLQAQENTSFSFTLRGVDVAKGSIDNSGDGALGEPCVVFRKIDSPDFIDARSELVFDVAPKFQLGSGSKVPAPDSGVGAEPLSDELFCFSDSNSKSSCKFTGEYSIVGRVDSGVALVPFRFSDFPPEFFIIRMTLSKMLNGDSFYVEDGDGVNAVKIEAGAEDGFKFRVVGLPDYYLQVSPVEVDVEEGIPQVRNEELSYIW